MFCMTALGSAMLSLVASSGCSSEETEAPPPPGALTMYLGTYTKGWACDKNDCTSKGIYKAAFDPATGKIYKPTLAGATINPSYLAKSADKKFLFAVNEVDDFKTGEKVGAVSSFAIGADGNLTLINQVSSLGADPCHISVTKAGQVMVANYSGGSVATYMVGADGKLAEGNLTQHTGSGPHPNQTSAHAHFIVESPKTAGLVYVADLGMDQVTIYKIGADAKLTPNTPPMVMLTPGSGPRHIAFHPTKDLVYVNSELSSSVTVFTLDPATGGLTELQTIKSNPATSTEASDTAELQITPNGNTLYVSNRGPNSIGTFTIGADGKLTAMDFPKTMGDWPRDFKLDPTGKFVLVGHQKSNDIFVFKIGAGGKLEPAGQSRTLSKPVNFLFL
jgi:6-phosphogluconolactonase